MNDNKKITLEYRHYDIYEDFPILPLVGSGWIRNYEIELNRYHFHNHLEIGYCYWGQGQIYIDDEVFDFKHGDFTFIPKNIPHTTQSKGDTYAKWGFFFVDLELLANQYNDKHKRYVHKLINKTRESAFVANENDFPDIAMNIINLINYFENDIKKNKMIYCNIMMDFFLEICNQLLEDNQLIERRSDKRLFQVSPALTYISKYYYKNISIGELAEACFLSETHFRRCFQRTMMMSPLEYIHQIRIEHACELLNDTSLSINKIAKRVGYSSLVTFNRNFQKRIHETPLKWRNLPDNSRKNLSNYAIRKLDGWR